ncbi:MAG: hypothetical protein K1Y02_11060 [Candidatus Hydrogenedentes bacterium]|nr:hypothetical protein [Candidatus Hydrogenedentota bacterium]
MLCSFVVVAVLSGGILQRQEAPGENIERIVTEGVERIVSSVMGAPATVGGIRWDREKQRLTLKDVTLANPSGFSEGDAIALGTVELEADIRSLMSEQPDVRLISVEGAHINAETSLQGNNLKKLMDNAKQAMPKGMRPRGGLQRGEKRWRIERVAINDSSLTMNSPLLGGSGKEKKIDGMEMSFTGPNNEGMTSQEIMVQIMQKLIDESGLLGGSGEDGAAESPVNALIDLLGPKQNK